MFDGEKCVRCNQHFKFDDLIYRSNALGYCRECDAKLDPSREPTRTCPHDGKLMKKSLIYDRVLIDHCPGCGGIWFDGDEIELMRKLVLMEGARSPINLVPFFMIGLASGI
jgi:hypothetical protein